MKLSPPQCLWTGTKCPGEQCEISQPNTAIHVLFCSGIQKKDLIWAMFKTRMANCNLLFGKQNLISRCVSNSSKCSPLKKNPCSCASKVHHYNFNSAHLCVFEPSARTESAATNGTIALLILAHPPNWRHRPAQKYLTSFQRNLVYNL